MILVDTSIWIDHFRTANQQLVALLNRNEVLVHPYIIGEIALGSVAKRADILRYLNNMPAAVGATHDEVMVFIDRHGLANTGVGYVDATLLASAALTPSAALWAQYFGVPAGMVRLWKLDSPSRIGLDQGHIMQSGRMASGVEYVGDMCAGITPPARQPTFKY